MATEKIAVTKEAYDRLRGRKGPDESFSDVILRTAERRPLADFSGMLKPASAEALRRAIGEARRERHAMDVGG